MNTAARQEEEMIRVIRLVGCDGKANAGEAFDFDDSFSVSAFMLGRRVDNYLIVKDGYVFRPSTFEVTQLEKELELFNGAKNTEQQDGKKHYD